MVKIIKTNAKKEVKLTQGMKKKTVARTRVIKVNLSIIKYEKKIKFKYRKT